MPTFIGGQPDIALNSPDVADIAAQPGFDVDPLELVDTPSGSNEEGVGNFPAQSPAEAEDEDGLDDDPQGDPSNPTNSPLDPIGEKT